MRLIKQDADCLDIRRKKMSRKKTIIILADVLLFLALAALVVFEMKNPQGGLRFVDEFLSRFQ